MSKTADIKCPECGAEMWDNREGKTNPKAPDFRCKLDKEHVVWPPRKPQPFDKPFQEFQEKKKEMISEAQEKKSESIALSASIRDGVQIAIEKFKMGKDQGIFEGMVNSDIDDWILNEIKKWQKEIYNLHQ